MCRKFIGKLKHLTQRLLTTIHHMVECSECKKWIQNTIALIRHLKEE